MAAFDTIGDVLKQFADYPPERIRLTPVPGTATKQDVIDAERKGKLCELIEGVLVEKAVGFKEGFVEAVLIQLLRQHAKAFDAGVVVGSSGMVELFPGQVRIPDVGFYVWDRLPGRRIPDDPVPELVPDLAIEVLSRSNTRGEMFAKLKDYFFAGTRLVWYVDPRAQTVDTYTGVDAGTTLGPADTLTGGDVLPGFAVPVADLFR